MVNALKSENKQHYLKQSGER